MCSTYMHACHPSASASACSSSGSCGSTSCPHNGHCAGAGTFVVKWACDDNNKQARQRPLVAAHNEPANRPNGPRPDKSASTQRSPCGHKEKYKACGVIGVACCYVVIASAYFARASQLVLTCAGCGSTQGRAPRPAASLSPQAFRKWGTPAIYFPESNLPSTGYNRCGRTDPWRMGYEWCSR